MFSFTVQPGADRERPAVTSSGQGHVYYSLNCTAYTLKSKPMTPYSKNIFFIEVYLCLNKKNKTKKTTEYYKLLCPDPVRRYVSRLIPASREVEVRRRHAPPAQLVFACSILIALPYWCIRGTRNTSSTQTGEGKTKAAVFFGHKKF